MNSERTYSIEPYNPDWVTKFNTIKKVLEEVFGTMALSIEHVGSTSVVGMKAKPLIDVLVIVENITSLERVKEEMISTGYILRENVLDERSVLFEKIVGTEKIENIHVFETGAPRIKQFINVRDYLRTHSERAGQYSALKEKLKIEHPDDYLSYRPGKFTFLQETARLANEWAENKE